jgi:thiol-disulfide isomerase/thioredoxin
VIVLVAATILIGVVALLNLTLTFAVIRRLREQAARPAGDRGPGVLPEPLAALIGRDLPDFTAVTTAGQTFSRDDVVGRPHLLGFFSVTCAPCKDQAPLFAEEAGDHSVAVVTGDGDGVQDLLNLLPGTVVITGAEANALAAGLGVRAFPSIVRTDERGRIVEAMLSIRDRPRKPRTVKVDA